MNTTTGISSQFEKPSKYVYLSGSLKNNQAFRIPEEHEHEKKKLFISNVRSLRFHSIPISCRFRNVSVAFLDLSACTTNRKDGFIFFLSGPLQGRYKHITLLPFPWDTMVHLSPWNYNQLSKSFSPFRLVLVRMPW